MGREDSGSTKLRAARRERVKKLSWSRAVIFFLVVSVRYDDGTGQVEMNATGTERKK